MLEKTIFHWIATYGYAAIVFLLMLGIVGLPVPDETLLTFSGYLIFKAQFHWAPAMMAALIGSITGMTISYMLGRTFGLPLIHRYGRYLRITDEELHRTHRWLEHAGAWSLTFGYYLPGIRHLTAYVAGTAELEMSVFALYAYAGAMLWATTFITAGYVMGEEWSKLSGWLHSYGWIGTVSLGVLILIALGARYALQRRPGRRPAQAQQK